MPTPRKYASKTEKDAAYYQRHKERIGQRTADYYAKVERYARYGMTKESFETRLAEQGGVCAVCKVVAERWAVDHDHRCCPGKRSCGKCVRGIVCTPCNSHGIPVAENVEWLEQLKSYLGGINDSI